MAAQQASSVFAFGEAVRHLERALQIQELVNPEDATHRCDLLIALSQALGPLGETQRVIEEVVPAAVALAEELGDARRAFRGCWIAVNCLDIYGGVAARARPEYAAWAERADRHAEAGGIDQVYARIMLAHAAAGQGRRDERDALLSQAVELAHHQTDSDTLFFAVSQALLTGPAQHWSERVVLAEESTRWPRDGVTARSLAVVLFHAGNLELSRGNRARAEELWNQLEELAERKRDGWLTLFALQAGLTLPIIDGEFESAVVRLDRFLQFAENVGAGVRGRRFRLVLSFWPWLELGRAPEWLAAFQEFRRVAGAGPGSDLQPLAALCQARLGRLEEARSLIGQQLDDATTKRSDDYCEPGYSLPLLETAVLLQHPAAAAAIARNLECIAGLSVGDWFYTSVARHLASAAKLSGDRQRARAYYEQALEACAKIAFRPELALTHLDLAELLVDAPGRGDLLEARRHLDVAISELRHMNIQPALERALNIADRPQLSGLTTADRTDLSGREREVAALLARGTSNREIAEALVISEGTVEVHVKHILSKLGLRSRAQVAAWLVGHESPTRRAPQF